MKGLSLLACFAFAGGVWAQESGLGADFRKEGERFEQNCVGFKPAGCAQQLFTDHPLHIAVGSLAPLNGFGSGLAFITHYTPNEDWRIFWNADAVGTPNGSWRAGGYMSAVLIRHEKITTRMGTAGKQSSSLVLQEKPVFHAYAQSTSLNRISYYGLGPGSSRNPSYFGLSETIVGGNVVWPFFRKLNVSLLAEMNGRFFSIRSGEGAGSVSIEQAHNEASAPGLLEPARLRPVRRGHSFTAQSRQRLCAPQLYGELSGMGRRQFHVFLSTLQCGSCPMNFRFIGTLAHLLPSEFNGPDTCADNPSSLGCPTHQPQLRRQLRTSLSLHVFLHLRKQVWSLLP